MFILYLLLLINFIVLGNNFGRNFELIFTASKDTINLILITTIILFHLIQLKII